MAPAAQASHDSMCRSVPQIPALRTRMRTSLMPISGSGTSSSPSPGPDVTFTRARMDTSRANGWPPSRPTALRRPLEGRSASSPRYRGRRNGRRVRAIRPYRDAAAEVTLSGTTEEGRTPEAFPPGVPANSSRGHILVHSHPITVRAVSVHHGPRAFEQVRRTDAKGTRSRLPRTGRGQTRRPSRRKNLGVESRPTPAWRRASSAARAGVVPLRAGHGPHASPDLRTHPGRCRGSTSWSSDTPWMCVSCYLCAVRCPPEDPHP